VTADIHIHLQTLAHDFVFDACQIPLNCFDAPFRSFEAEVLPVLLSRGIAPIGMKSLGGDARQVAQKVVENDPAYGCVADGDQAPSCRSILDGAKTGQIQHGGLVVPVPAVAFETGHVGTISATRAVQSGTRWAGATTMKRIVFAFVLVPALAGAQDAAEVRKLYEAGRYQQVVEASGDTDTPAVVYTAGQSHQKLGATDQARETYGQLAARAEDDPWHFIGLSAQQLLDEQTDAALASATQAVAMAGRLAEAHFQLGLVLAKQEDWRAAADAFDRAAEINPALAYAHYYGGLMHYRAGRPDRMAIHFEQFLKLAPEAPERPEVMQIMRTVRGR